MFAGDRFFAFGAACSLVSSADATNWVLGSSRVSGPLYDLTFGNGRYVAVGGVQTYVNSIGYTNYALVSVSEDGQTWTGFTNMLGVYFNAVAFGEGTFVATGGGYSWTSPNGVEWTRGEEIRGASALAYGPGGFLAVGGEWFVIGTQTGTYRYAYSSTNGRHWICLVNTSDPVLGWITAGADRFVALGGPISVFLPSTNGSWQIQDAPGVGGSGLAYGDGLFFNGASESPDGLTWTNIPYHTETVLEPQDSWETRALAFGQGKWVRVGMGGLIGVSTNRVDWSYPTIVAGVPLNSICQGTDVLVAVGGIAPADSNGRGIVLTSTDGQIWVNRPVPARVQLNCVIYEAGLYVAVGGDSQRKDSGVLLISSNGIDWIERPFAPQTPLRKVVYGNGVFAAAGSYRSRDSITGQVIAQGLLLKSSDGQTWNNQILTAEATYPDIVFGNGRFVLRSSALTPSGWASPRDAAYASTNLVDWSKPFEVMRMGALAFVDGQFHVAASIGPGGSTDAVISSTNGVDWLVTPIHNEQPTRIIFAQHSYFGVNGTNLLSSDDGVSWTVRKTWPMPLIDLACLNRTLLVVGGQGTIAQSGLLDPRSLILAATITRPGEVHYQVQSEVGEIVTLETSTDLKNWGRWLDITNSTGAFRLVDTIAPESGGKFYRARSGR